MYTSSRRGLVGKADITSPLRLEHMQEEGLQMCCCHWTDVVMMEREAISSWDGVSLGMCPQNSIVTGPCTIAVEQI